MNNHSFGVDNNSRDMRTYAPVNNSRVFMPRSLTRSNRQYQKAVGKLPLGVSSNFRFWGEDKTIYIDHGQRRPDVGHRR